MELKVNMRQQNDISFSQILNHLKKGGHTADDIKALQGCLVSGESVDLSVSPFDTALRLYPCTVNVDEYNESQIANLAKKTKLYVL